VVNTSAGPMEFTTTTNADGYAFYTFVLQQYVPGDYVLYSVTASYGTLSESASEDFITWGDFAP
ncbi:MAG TPA: hypothetical protein VI547_10500, partial [Anaerolineales bacterium]|nr:hypothetical protein [Anaerolineales bacterium]